MFINFSIFLRRKINLLLIITSTCLGSLIFLNADKLIFEVEANNINVKNLISTRVGLLIFAFFFVSLVLYTLNVSGIKKFSESSIEQYISWFFTALGVATNWMFYRFSIDLYTALKQNLHIDTLYQGLFVTVKRVWNKNELLDILNDELLKYKEIIFSNEEKANLIHKAETSVESLISELHILCEIKQNELLQSKEATNLFLSKWKLDGLPSWLPDTISKGFNFVCSHPFEIMAAIFAFTFVWAGVQNFFFQKTTSSMLSDAFIESSVNNDRILSTAQQLDMVHDSILRLDNLANGLARAQRSNNEHLVSYLSDVANDITGLSDLVNSLRVADSRQTQLINILFRILNDSNLLPDGMTIPSGSGTPEHPGVFVPFSGSGYRLGRGEENS